MHADRGAVGDALPRDVGDFAFDRVVVADAVAAGRLELDVEAALGVGRVLVGAQLGAAVGRRAGAEVEALEREVAEQGRRRAVGGRPRVGPADRSRLHGGAEQVARGDGAGELRAGERRGAGERGIDAEVRPAVGGDEEAAADGIARLEALGLTLDLVLDVELSDQLGRGLLGGVLERTQPHQHRVVAERAFGRQRVRPLDRAPRRQRHLALIDLAILAVADAHVDRRAGVRHLDAGGGVVAQDGLVVDLFAEAVDAAIGEHRAAQQRVLLGGVIADAELPRVDAFGPVRAEVGEVAVLLGRHQELELRLVPALRAAQRQRRRDGHAVGVGRAGPGDLVLERDERDLGAFDRRGVVEARHEHQRVLRAVLDRQAQVGDLDDGGAGPRLVAVGPRAGNRLAFLDRGPHQAVAAGERPGQLDAVRLDAIRLRRQPPVLRRRLGCAPEVVGLEGQQRRHQLARGDGRDPLLHHGEVAGVEREHRAAGRLPHAVAVAEAGEGRRVPVLDDAHPRVAEGLAVGGLQRRREPHGVAGGRLLGVVAEILEGERLAAVGVAVGGGGRRFPGDRPGRRGGDVGDRDGLADVFGQRLAAQAHRVPAVRVALGRARRLVDEERRLELHRVGLRPGRWGIALNATHPGRHVERDPALGRRHGGGLHDHEIRLRLAQPVLIPRGGRRHDHAGGRVRGRRGGGDLGLEGRQAGRVRGLKAGPRRGRHRRRRPVVGLVGQRQALKQVDCPHRLVEPQADRRPGASKRLLRRYQFVASSFTVGVVKANV